MSDMRILVTKPLEPSIEDDMTKLRAAETKSSVADGAQGDGHGHWSNHSVLAVTTASFAIFVVAEIIGALASNSLSLLG